MRQRLGMLLIAFTTLGTSAGPLAGAGPTEAPPAVPLLASASLLRVQAAEPDLTGAVRSAPGRWERWELTGGRDAAVIRIMSADDADHWAEYLISPWQDLHPAAPADPDEVFAVTADAIVIGPRVAGDAPATFVHATRRVMGRMTDRDISGRSISRGGGVHFHPYAARVERDDPLQPGSWRELAANRVVLHLEDGRLVGVFAPREVDRTRPRPFDPGEQRLSPDVDLAAEGRRLDAELRRVFDRAIHEALMLEDPTPQARQAVYLGAVPELKKAVFAYAGHTGPAFAAGAQALQREQGRLQEIIVDLGFPSAREGDWPGGLLLYAPHLAEALLKLPPAEPDALPDLLAAYDRWQAEASREGRQGDGPPSDAQLLWAEAGDRLRTAARPAEDADVRAALGQRDPVIRYRGHRLWIEDPMGEATPVASPGVEITANLLGAPGPHPFGP